MRVDNLVAEGADGEVRSLGNEDELVGGRLAYDTTIDWPEAAKDTEERGFAATVRSDDQQMLLWKKHMLVIIMA